MAKRCVFCGGQANSREHVFPAWISKILPGSGNLTHTRSGEHGSAWTTSGDLDFKVKQVCRTCNNGWLSDLETRTKELLSPLVLGQRTRSLTVPEQKKLAVWAYKTAIVLALMPPSEERFVPLEHYREFRETQTPPDDTWIWLAGLAPNSGHGEFRAGWSQPEPLDYSTPDGRPKDRHGYRLSFSVVSLVFQVVWDAYGARLARIGESRDIFTRIRPISKGEWPRRRLLTIRV